MIKLSMSIFFIIIFLFSNILTAKKKGERDFYFYEKLTEMIGNARQGIYEESDYDLLISDVRGLKSIMPQWPKEVYLAEVKALKDLDSQAFAMTAIDAYFGGMLGFDSAQARLEHCVDIIKSKNKETDDCTNIKSERSLLSQLLEFKKQLDAFSNYRATIRRNIKKLPDETKLKQEILRLYGMIVLLAE